MDLSPEGAGRPGAPRYAGFWIRVFANALDTLMVAAVNMGVALAVGAGLASAPSGGIGSVSATITDTALQALALLPALAVIAFWALAGATPGKMICGIRIVDAVAGGRPTLWQCIGRYVMALLALALAGIGYVWIAIDARKQGWHDKIVRTLVIHRGGAA